MGDIPAIARGLTKAQREAIIKCVYALSDLAGEGICICEDAIFDLFEAFHRPGDEYLSYPEWVRHYLETQSHD